LAVFNLKGISNKGNINEEQAYFMHNRSMNENLKLLSETDRIYKDEDFNKFEISISLSNKDGVNLQSLVRQDAEFLKSFGITDYSLLVSIHKFTHVENFQLKFDYRTYKSYDNLFLYSFAIIDFFKVR